MFQQANKNACSTFPGQHPQEKVKFRVQAHFARKLIWLGYFLFFGLFLPVIFIFVFIAFNPDLLHSAQANFLLAIYLLFVWLFNFVELIKIELTVLFVTNERILAIEQNSLFSHKILEANLSRIQDVSGLMQGFVAIFEIGTLIIRTAGSNTPIALKFVKTPHLIAREILNMQKSAKPKRRASDPQGSLLPWARENFSREGLIQM